MLKLLVVEISSEAGVDGESCDDLSDVSKEILCPLALCFNNINPDNLFVNKYNRVVTNIVSKTNKIKYP